MALTCKCETGLSNTGYPTCVELLSVAAGFIMVPYFDADGNVNSIDLTDTLDSAYVVGKLNESDADKRWYPVMNIKNVEDLRGDPEFETFNDNSKMRVQNGTRNFKGFGPAVHNKLIGNINDSTCELVGIFIVGINGQLQGNDASAGFLYPIAIAKNSFVATLFKPQDKAVQKMMVEFQFDQSEDDRNLAFISREEFDNYDLTKIKGLQDAIITVVANSTTTTGCLIKIATQFGTAITKDPVTGLVTADFISADSAATSKVFNVDDALDVTVTAAETVDGTYTLAWVAQGTTEVIQILAKKNGFAFTTTETTIP